MITTFDHREHASIGIIYGVDGFVIEALRQSLDVFRAPVRIARGRFGPTNPAQTGFLSLEGPLMKGGRGPGIEYSAEPRDPDRGQPVGRAGARLPRHRRMS